jgi:hypothetical protein
MFLLTSAFNDCVCAGAAGGASVMSLLWLQRAREGRGPRNDGNGPRSSTAAAAGPPTGIWGMCRGGDALKGIFWGYIILNPATPPVVLQV